MNLPYTSGSLLFWLDPSEKFVYRDASNKVTSMIDRVNESVALSPTVASRPTWRDNRINGRPVLSFAGAQRMRLPLNSRNIINGTNVPTVITCLMQDLGTADGSVVDLGHTTNVNPEQGIIVFGGIVSYRFDNHSSVSGDFGNPITINQSPHVITYLFDGAHIIVRIDGVQRDSIPNTLTTGNFSCDQFAIGDVTDAFFAFGGSFPFIGNIGQVIGYQQKDPDFEPETYLMQYYGL